MLRGCVSDTGIIAATATTSSVGTRQQQTPSTAQSCPRSPRRRPCIHETGTNIRARDTRCSGEADEYCVRVLAASRGPFSSASCDGETMAATAAPSAAAAASLAANAANSSRRMGAAACIGWSGAPARASSKATWVPSSGGRTDWGADPTGVASSDTVCGGTGSATAEASCVQGLRWRRGWRRRIF